jgi:hypothetical protein
LIQQNSATNDDDGDAAEDRGKLNVAAARLRALTFFKFSAL